MKKKIYLLPLAMLSLLFVFTIGCEEDTEEEEDLCQMFEGVPEECEIPTICCPVDGGDCYYVNPDGGEDYYCDADLDSEENPDGCNGAMDEYINNHCSKMTKSTETALRADLTKFTKKLMEEARLYSVCN